MSIALEAEATKVAAPSASDKGSSIPFGLVLCYLFLEFGRPQDSLLGLEQLHLPSIVVSLIGIALLFSGRLCFSDKQTKLYLLLLVLMTAHGPFALNNYWAFQMWKAMVITFTAYLGVITFVDSPKRFRRLIQVWLGVHAYLSVTGIVQGGRGIGGFLGDENDFCLTINMIIPYSFFLAISEEGKTRKLFFFGLTALFLFGNTVTFSRGGFVGLLAVGLYCWFKSPKRIFSAALILVLSLFIVYMAPEKYWEEIKSIQKGTSDPTGEGRTYLWKYSWKMFLDNPIVGVGQGNFPFQFNYYEGDDRLHGASRGGRAAHSLYFTLLPELGLVGALLFASMVYHAFKDTRFCRRLELKEAKPPGVSDDETAKFKKTAVFLTLALEASLVGYLVSGFFISVLYYPNFWLLIGLVVALKRLLLQLHEESRSSSD